MLYFPLSSYKGAGVKLPIKIFFQKYLHLVTSKYPTDNRQNKSLKLQQLISFWML